MVIFKGIRCDDSWIDSMPNCSVVEMAPKGSMTSMLFCKWLKHFSKFKAPGPCFLILDGAKCHINFNSFRQAEKFDVQLFLLPSNTTHELQPFDKTVFRPFELYWDEELLNYWSKFPEREMIKARFGHVLKPSWERAVTPKNITSGFKACEIYPFDPSVIPDVAFAPSEVTRQTDPNQLVPHQPDHNESNENPSNPTTPEKLQNCETSEKPPPTFTLLSTPKLSASKRKITKRGINVRAILLTEGDFPADRRKQHFSSEDDGSDSDYEIKKGKKSKRLKLKEPKRTFLTKLKEKLDKKKQQSKKPEASESDENTAPSKSSEKNEPSKSSETNAPSKSNKNKKLQKIENKKENLKENFEKGPKASTSQNESESWYCFLCNTNEKMDTRACSIFKGYIHEECASLTKDDMDLFVCPNCD